MLIFLSTVLIWVLTDTTRNKRKMVWRGYDTKATALLQQCCHIKNQSKRTFDHLKKTSKKKKKKTILRFYLHSEKKARYILCLLLSIRGSYWVFATEDPPPGFHRPHVMCVYACV